MKVSSKSWHYKLWRFGRESDSQPRDLCRYFWHLALVKVLIPAVILALAVTGIVLLGILIWENPTTTAIVVAIVLLGAALLAGLGYLGYRWYQRSEQKKAERRLLPLEPPREPGVMRSYLIARKRKVCPLITVVRAGNVK